MPIKDVFLPLVGQPSTPALAAIEKCVTVAAGLGARITALALACEEDTYERPKAMLANNQGAEEAGDSREALHMQQLLDAFTQATIRTNIRAQSRTATVSEDQIAPILAEQARFSDLTLVPVTPHDSRTESIVEAFLFRSGRPLLLCPQHLAGDLRPQFENVMIAWDHSARAARAVGDALPVLQAAASVRVVTVADETTDAIVRSGTALVDHLEEHGVHASFETTQSRGKSAGKALGNWANSHGMDAIVMGAYHHSRLNEIVWGGVTKTVIGQPPCWVMISH